MSSYLMSKTARVNFPIIPSGAPYIHLRMESYIEQTKGHPAKVVSDEDIIDIYKKNKELAASRFSKNLGLLPDMQQGRELLADVISLYNAGFDHKKGMEDSLREGVDQAVKRIKSANPSFKYSFGLKSTFKFLHESVDGLQSSIDEINGIVKELEKLDANIVNYYGYNGKSPLGQAPSKPNGLTMLNVDSKSQTSFINLKDRVQKLEMITAQHTGKLDEVVDVKMPDGTIENVKTKGVLWGMSQQLINIQGTILEAAALANLQALERELEEMFRKATGENVTVSVISDPGGTTYDEVLDKMVTNTSDISIKITRSNGEVSSTEINLGLSAKAQYKAGKAKAKVTTFKTSTVLNLLKKGQVLNTLEEYRFLNDIAFGRWKQAGTANIRKYLAAVGAMDAIGGTAGGDEIYLLVYIDQVLSVEQFFNALISNGQFLDIDIKTADKVANKKITSYGRKSIAEMAKEQVDSPNKQLAYQRSKALQILIHEMEQQLQIKY